MIRATDEEVTTTKTEGPGTGTAITTVGEIGHVQVRGRIVTSGVTDTGTGIGQKEAGAPIGGVMGIETRRGFGNPAANGGTAGIGAIAENGDDESGVQITGKGNAVGTGVTTEKGEESEAWIQGTEKGGAGMGSEMDTYIEWTLAKNVQSNHAMIYHAGESFRQNSKTRS